MRPSFAFFSVLLAFVPALVNAGMCVGWFDAKAVDAVEKCCTDLSGHWSPVSGKEAACLFRDEDIDAWQECANPLMHNQEKLPYSLHGWQCSRCGDVCTVTGGPTLTAPATKTPVPPSAFPSPIIYTPNPAAQEPMEEIK